ncbi:MAG: winged helix-turn-helix domain-containing protein [Candidatus Omnitrophica bacterium]|nr:winged helix-turn-helix domain-containing protein [Candidatus Omnitrophota bacterium]
MITEIGIIAGEIWNFLDKHGRVSLEQLTGGIDKPRELILMSLGWLAREGHVLVKRGDSVYQISLREKEQECEKA